MFSFFKRLIGKSADNDTQTDIDTDTDAPEENGGEDGAEVRSEPAEGLRHASTPALSDTLPLPPGLRKAAAGLRC